MQRRGLSRAHQSAGRRAKQDAGAQGPVAPERAESDIEAFEPAPSGSWARGNLRSLNVRPPRRSGAFSLRNESQVRRLFNEVFRKSRPEIEAALTKCFSSPKTVLACVELLARLDGELR